MKKFNLFLAIPVAIFLALFIAMIVLTGIALAESPSGWSELNYDVLKVAATKDGTVYTIDIEAGTNAQFRAQLPKQIPFVEPGETAIDFIVVPIHEDDPKNDNTPDDWVEVVRTYTVDDSGTKQIWVEFNINVPNDLPTDTYEFWAVTEGLDPQVGTTILKIQVVNLWSDNCSYRYL